MRMLIVLVIGFASGALVVGLLRPRPVWTAPSTADQLLPVEQALERPIRELDLIDVPLDEAVRRIGEATGVPAKLDLASFAGAPTPTAERITLRTRGLPLYMVLEQLRSQTVSVVELTWQANAGGILVWCRSTPAGSQITYATITREYEVADLLPKLMPEEPDANADINLPATSGGSIFGAPDPRAESRLVELVNGEIGTNDVVLWERPPSPGNARFQHNRLVVTGTLSAHLHARNALAEIRAASQRPQPHVPAIPASAQRWHPTLKKWIGFDSHATEQKLTKVIPEFRFSGKQRDAIFAWAKAADVDVVLADSPKPEDSNEHQMIVEFNELPIELGFKDVPAVTILHSILKNSRLAWQYDGSSIRIDWILWKQPYPTHTRTYDLTPWFEARQRRSAQWTQRDETAALEELKTYLTTSTEWDALHDGLVWEGEYKFVCRRAVVKHVTPMHLRVAELVKELNTQPFGDPTTRPGPTTR